MRIISCPKKSYRFNKAFWGFLHCVYRQLPNLIALLSISQGWILTCHIVWVPERAQKKWLYSPVLKCLSGPLFMWPWAISICTPNFLTGSRKIVKHLRSVSHTWLVLWVELCPLQNSSIEVLTPKYFRMSLFSKMSSLKLSYNNIIWVGPDLIWLVSL